MGDGRGARRRRGLGGGDEPQPSAGGGSGEELGWCRDRFGLRRTRRAIGGRSGRRRRRSVRRHRSPRQQRRHRDAQREPSVPCIRTAVLGGRAPGLPGRGRHQGDGRVPRLSCRRAAHADRRIRPDRQRLDERIDDDPCRLRSLRTIRGRGRGDVAHHGRRARRHRRDREPAPARRGHRDRDGSRRRPRGVQGPSHGAVGHARAHRLARLAAAAGVHNQRIIASEFDE